MFTAALFTIAVLVVKNSLVNAGDIREAGRWTGEGHGNPLQYSCLENAMDRVRGVAKSQTRLKWLSTWYEKDLKTTWVVLSQWIDEESMKDRNPVICDNMDETGGHYAKWNKAGRERLILHERKWKLLSHVRLFATQWAKACQIALSMEFSRPEYWSG